MFPRWFYSEVSPKPAMLLPVKWQWHGQGTAGTIPGPAAGAGPSLWEQPPLPCFTRRSFQLWLSHSCCSSFSLLVLDGSFPWKPTLGRAAGWDKHG